MTRGERLVRTSTGGRDLDLRVSSTGAAAPEGGGAFNVGTIGGWDGMSVAVTVQREDGGGAPMRARVALVDGVAWVFIDGETFRIEVADARQAPARRRAHASHGEALSAPMPATVTRVLVDVGQAVAAGDTLLLLEAMKMELPIKAPHDGRIAAVRCRAGELVHPGTPLIDFEESPDPGRR